jgi:hypothetical protein
MRTLFFLLGGCVLWTVCLGAAKLLANSSPDSTRIATGVFLVAWLVVAGANMWAGVTKAGYSVAEELPIFLLIFGLPAAVAVFVKWRFL